MNFGCDDSFCANCRVGGLQTAATLVCVCVNLSLDRSESGGRCDAERLSTKNEQAQARQGAPTPPLARPPPTVLATNQSCHSLKKNEAWMISGQCTTKPF